MSRVLVLASSIIPLPGLPTNGGGLRGWTLAQGLAAAGHDVTVLFPRNSLDEQRAEIAAAARAAALPHTFEWSAPLAAIEEHRPDVVVACSWLLAGQLPPCPVPLAVDVAGPVLLEFIAQGGDKAAALAHYKTAGLARADYVTCAGDRQRPYFYPWLILAGFAPEDCLARFGVVPISCDPATPPHDPPAAEPTIVFAGLALAWQDPVAPLEAALATIERRGRGRLAIYADAHPVHSRGAAWFAWLRDRVRGHDRATLHGLVPYDALLAVYRSADLALDLFARTVERELAFNTRTVDYLRCGVPPLYGDYAELSDLIGDYRAGFVVDPRDAAQVAAAVELALDCPERLAEASRGAQRLARERLAWDRTIGPLADFCAAPSKRRPGPLSPHVLVADLARDRTELALRDAEIERLRAYAARVEGEWRAKSAYGGALEAELAAWRRSPWRQSLTQMVAAAVGRVRSR
jgi:hypothetical protein